MINPHCVFSIVGFSLSIFLCKRDIFSTNYGGILYRMNFTSLAKCYFCLSFTKYIEIASYLFQVNEITSCSELKKLNFSQLSYILTYYQLTIVDFQVQCQQKFGSLGNCKINIMIVVINCDNVAVQIPWTLNCSQCLYPLFPNGQFIVISNCIQSSQCAIQFHLLQLKQTVFICQEFNLRDLYHFFLKSLVLSVRYGYKIPLANYSLSICYAINHKRMSGDT